MKRITAVFPSRAEAEAAYVALRGLDLAQGAISLLADSSNQVNPYADDLRSRDSHLDRALETSIAPLGIAGGFGVGGGTVLGGSPVPIYGVTSSVDSGHAQNSQSSLADPLNPERALELDTRSEVQASSGPFVSGTLEGFSQAGFPPDEAEYYSSAISQGHAVLSVELGADEQEAGVRQIIGQNEGHPFMGTPQ